MSQVTQNTVKEEFIQTLKRVGETFLEQAREESNKWEVLVDDPLAIGIEEASLLLKQQMNRASGNSYTSNSNAEDKIEIRKFIISGDDSVKLFYKLNKTSASGEIFLVIRGGEPIRIAKFEFGDTTGSVISQGYSAISAMVANGTLTREQALAAKRLLDRAVADLLAREILVKKLTKKMRESLKDLNKIKDQLILNNR